MKCLTRTCLIMFALAVNSVVLSAPEFVTPTKPARDKVKDFQVQPAPKADTTVQVPMITWGADAVTIYANGGNDTTPQSLFGKAGLNVKIVKQDDLVQQVKDYREGRSPFIRGTMGMINAYSEALNADPRTQPVVILQLSWSAGGDCLVVRESVKSPADLKGKTIVLQQYGPHLSYLDRVLRDSSLGWSDVNIKFCEELYDLDGKPNDPASIMRQDQTVDAIFCISPDASDLTSQMKVGTGSEKSVKGARVLLSTKTAAHVIADVYAVRKDFYDTHKDWVDKFVKAHTDAQQIVSDLIKKNNAEFESFVKLCAEKLLDNPEDTVNMKGMLTDCQLVLAAGNADYFANKNNLVGFAATMKRLQDFLVEQGYLTQHQSLNALGWSKPTGPAATPAIQFKQDVAQKVAAEAGDDSILFSFEINFSPNQNDFPAAQYGEQFRKVLELAAVYPGALIEVVGYSDPYRYLKMKIKDHASEEVLARQAQSGLNLSLARSNSVRGSVIEFAKSQNVFMNESQFISTGKGYADPKVADPQSEADLAKNRRVVFRVINIEGESTEMFEPLNGAK